MQPFDELDTDRENPHGAAIALKSASGIHSLGEALHYEFKPRGVYVTVVPPPLTNTPVLAKLGFDPRTMPMKPMSVEQCVSEGLNALRENRSRIVPGRLNRFMDAFVPAFVKRTMTAKMLGKALAKKEAATAGKATNTAAT